MPDVCRLMITGCLYARLVEFTDVRSDFFCTDFRADSRDGVREDYYFRGVLDVLLVRLRDFLSLAARRAISFSAFWRAL